MKKKDKLEIEVGDIVRLFPPDPKFQKNIFRVMVINGSKSMILRNAKKNPLQEDFVEAPIANIKMIRKDNREFKLD